MSYPKRCPDCGSRDIHDIGNIGTTGYQRRYICGYCDEEWVQ